MQENDALSQEHSPLFGEESVKSSVKKRSHVSTWLTSLLLLLILAAGAYFRFSGLNWDEYSYMHPDERFLLMVAASLTPPQSVEEYFDTAHSSFNPHNRGYTFYVYGTFPLFLARYAAEWVYEYNGMQAIADAGRFLSAFFDFLVILIVFLIGKRAYGLKVGLLAAAFYAAAVLPIQLSHFFKEDTFLNFFTGLAVYLALVILLEGRQHNKEITDGLAFEGDDVGVALLPSPALFIAFGTTVGLALASKLNAAPVAFLLPIAVLLRYNHFPLGLKKAPWNKIILYLVFAALACLVTFRIFQPYAFTGPSFWGVRLNPEWIADIQEQRAQATGDVDFPPAMQWARRSWWFSGENLIRWGLGVPLGLASAAGFLALGWLIGMVWLKKLCLEKFNGENSEKNGLLKVALHHWKQSTLLWIWAAFYFFWQSFSFNPTMRYQLPIYPIVVVFAAWGIIALWNAGKQAFSKPILGRWLQGIAVACGVIVLSATTFYAAAFWNVHNTPFTRVDASRWIYQNVLGPVTIRIQTREGVYQQPLAYPPNTLITPASPWTIPFIPQKEGLVNEVILYHVRDIDGIEGEKTLHVYITDQPNVEQTPFQARVKASFLDKPDDHFDGYRLRLDNPLMIKKDQTYFIVIAVEATRCALTMSGETIANEGDWDDSLPLRVENFDGFGGIYPPDVTFQMYWEDNKDKLARFLDVMDKADYIVITSNRQWGSLTRLPERFPLVTAYYRYLMGCPASISVEDCYRNAQVGMYKGALGFELIKVFQSNPRLAGIEFNDQYAEEAFTVYDHPKVMIFKKTFPDKSFQRQQLLSAVDLDHVLHITPKQAKPYPMNLLLPYERLIEQRNGGTWRELFDMEVWFNKVEVGSVIIWYLGCLMIGLVVYPLVHFVFGGLSDKGYPLARVVGMILWAWVAWLGSSFRIPFNRPWLLASFGIIALVSLGVAYLQRDELIKEWREKRFYYLKIEMLALIAFLFVLMIRWGNPDLWHPWKGGEKPMEFSYFNAVIKSTSFPPYDPWFAGGYINYYYYGYVIASLLVKLFGILPSIGYNLMLATLFSWIVLGAFSIVYNLQSTYRWFGGMAGAVGVALIGNLGTWRMIIRGFQQIAAPNQDIEALSQGAFSFLTRWWYTLQGLIKALAGTPLPYSPADWYWIPSRVIAAQGDVEPITEFPFFTVLYADLHAHLFALPITIVGLSWVYSFIVGSYQRKAINAKRNLLWVVASLLMGALIIGTLRPTNTWDFPTYLLLGSVGIGYAVWCNREKGQCMIKQLFPYLQIGLFLLLAFMLYDPFSRWFGQGYNALEVWRGPRTPIGDYLTHWGVFLFFIVSWMVAESIDWMEKTPLSHVRKLMPYRSLIFAVMLCSAFIMLILGIKLPMTEGLPQLPFNLGFLIFGGVSVVWFVIPLFLWAIVLFLRPQQEIHKRFVLALFSLGLLLTLFVEMFTLQGDIGRMNTVFKFYLQTWVLFGVSAAACLGWLLPSLMFDSLPNNPGTHSISTSKLIWQLFALFLVGAAALYPLTAAPAKISDRMANDAPHSLNGMTYMAYSTYNDQGIDMDLGQDYEAIYWMLQHVDGSPVIVEGNTPEYRWGSRFTIYTGLPGVVGWNWHQRQQRGFVSNEWVTDRVAEIASFYQTTNTEEAVQFLKRYQVKYIILGQLERIYYPGMGLEKFDLMNGVLWKEVFRDRDTVVYEVMNNYN